MGRLLGSAATHVCVFLVPSPARRRCSESASMWWYGVVRVPFLPSSCRGPSVPSYRLPSVVSPGRASCAGFEGAPPSLSRRAGRAHPGAVAGWRGHGLIPEAVGTCSSRGRPQGLDDEQDRPRPAFTESGTAEGTAKPERGGSVKDRDGVTAQRETLITAPTVLGTQERGRRMASLLFFVDGPSSLQVCSRPW